MGTDQDCLGKLADASNQPGKVEPRFFAQVLVRGRWGGILNAVEAAAEWGLRPTVLTGTDFSAEWTSVDRLLAVAYVLAKKTMCSGCGHSLIRTSDEDAIGEIEVHHLWCEGCEQLERDREASKDAPAADKAYLVDTGS